MRVVKMQKGQGYPDLYDLAKFPRPVPYRLLKVTTSCYLYSMLVQVGKKSAVIFIFPVKFN